MFGVIVLHQTLTVGVDSLQKWEQCWPYNVNIQNCIHYAVENAYSCTSSMTDSGPYMNLHRIFCPTVYMYVQYNSVANVHVCWLF